MDAIKSIQPAPVAQLSQRQPAKSIEPREQPKQSAQDQSSKEEELAKVQSKESEPKALDIEA